MAKVAECNRDFATASFRDIVFTVAIQGGVAMTLMRTLARSYRPSAGAAGAVVVVTTILLAAFVGANSESLPFKYLSGLESRWNAAEFVCTATVSDVVPSGMRVIENTTVREYLVTAYVDRVFRGDWAQQQITFRSYGLKTPQAT